MDHWGKIIPWVSTGGGGGLLPIGGIVCNNRVQTEIRIDSEYSTCLQLSNLAKNFGSEWIKITPTMNAPRVKLKLKMFTLFLQLLHVSANLYNMEYT